MTVILKLTYLDQNYNRLFYDHWMNFVEEPANEETVTQALERYRARFVCKTDAWHLEFPSEHDKMLFVMRFS